MQKNCFLSRNLLIQWVNNLLQINLTCIQQLGCGSIYCHILDAAYPQKVPLYKLKWNAYRQTDFIHNFKILQTSFQHLGIEKQIDIQRLIKAKFQDNLQLLQWMKIYLSPIIQSARYQYQPLVRRKGAKINLQFLQKDNLSNYSSSNKLKKNDHFSSISSITGKNKNMVRSQAYGTPSQSNKQQIERSSILLNRKSNTAKNKDFNANFFSSSSTLNLKNSCFGSHQNKENIKRNTKKEHSINKISDFNHDFNSQKKKIINGIMEQSFKLTLNQSSKGKNIKQYKKKFVVGLPLKDIQNVLSSRGNPLDNPFNQELQYF